MRLVFIDPEPPSATGGGIRTYLHWVSALCRAQGIDVRIYTHNPAAYEDARPIGRLPCWPRGIRGLAYRFLYAETVAFESAFWLADELRKTRPDFAEFADFQGYAYYAVRDRALRRRIALRVHTPLYLVYADLPRKRGAGFWCLRRREQSALRRAVWITAPSADFIQEKMPWLRPPRIIPNPPPTPAQHRSVGDGRQKNANVFLGRLEPRKGALELLQAFLSLAGDFPDTTLSFIGEPIDAEYQTALQRALEGAPMVLRHRVHWLPAQTGDKNSWLQTFSLLVVPSHWENCPYVFWEGMAAGIPCLGTETGEMKRARQMTQAPVAAPADSVSLAQALRRFLSDPRIGSDLIARQDAYLQRVSEEACELPYFYQACSRGP